MTTSALSALIDELGAGVVVTDPEILASYRHDWARDPDAGMPLAVAFALAAILSPTDPIAVQAVAARQCSAAPPGALPVPALRPGLPAAPIQVLAAPVPRLPVQRHRQPVAVAANTQN